MEGYYRTPNKMIPLNDRDPGEIADVALEQLKAWESIAESWDVYTDGRSNRCKECHQNIWFSTDPQRGEYMYAPGEILALKVAHVRQCHSEASSRDYLHNVDSSAHNGQGNNSSQGDNR
jgi:hypothetical protein